MLVNSSLHAVCGKMTDKYLVTETSTWTPDWHFMSVFQRLVYEGIYSFCHEVSDVVTMSSDVDGDQAFEQFPDSIAETLNRQWSENRTSDKREIFIVILGRLNLF